MSIKFSGFDEIRKSLENLPDKILDGYKNYADEIRKEAIKNCNLLESELKLELIREKTSLRINFPNVDEKKLECIKNAILKVKSPDGTIKKIMLNHCEKVREEIKSKTKVK